MSWRRKRQTTLFALIHRRRKWHTIPVSLQRIPHGPSFTAPFPSQLLQSLVCEMVINFPDCKGDLKRNTKLDTVFSLQVLYCGVCSLLREYCEYMPDVAKCRQWLEKNFSKEFAKLAAENSPKQERGIREGPGIAEEEEENKKQKKKWKGSDKNKKEDSSAKATIAKISTVKKKYLTRMCGLGTSEIDLKDAQRFFAQKISCGASVIREDEIIVQGNFSDDIIDVIQEKWPEVDDDSIEDLREVKK